MTANGSFTLTESESLEIADRVAALAEAGLPLAAGLRAAAAEMPRQRVARALESLAAEADAGRALDTLLGDERRVPPYVAGLVTAGLRAGQFPQVLREVLAQRRAAQDLFRSVASALAYPALLLVFFVALLVLVMLFVVPPHLEVLNAYNIKRPYPTQVLIVISGGVTWLMNHGPRVAVVALAAFVISVLLGRFVIGAPRCSRWLMHVPLFGPLWHWISAANFCHLLAIFVELQTPLPAALQLAAGGARDPNFRAAGRKLAGAVAAGTPLALAVLRTPGIPRLLAPLLHWGEQSGTLASALRTAADVMSQRALLRAEWLKVVLPPFLFMVIAVATVYLVQGLLLPLVSLIEYLSK